MKGVLVEITGKTPLLMRRFTDEAAMKATDGTGTAVSTANGKTPMEQAAEGLYKDEKGKIGIPQPNLFRCLIDAGKFFKIGRTKVTTQKSSMVPSALELDGLFYHVKHKEPWSVDTRPIRIPATGGRILRHRPCFNDWAIRFQLSYDPSIMEKKMVRDLVDAAGSRIGLGDFRPDCKGPFGKFVVTLWKEA